MAKRVQSTELGASNRAIDIVRGRFVDLALAFASVDPIATEETLRIIETRSLR